MRSTLYASRFPSTNKSGGLTMVPSEIFRRNTSNNLSGLSSDSADFSIPSGQIHISTRHHLTSSIGLYSAVYPAIVKANEGSEGEATDARPRA